MCCCTSEIIEIDCRQISVSDGMAPIIPPDNQECVQRGSRVRIEYDNVKEARSAYKTGMLMHSSRHNQRKYLRGSRYVRLLRESSSELDVRDYGGMLDLVIGLDSSLGGGVSRLKVRDLSNENELMSVVREFNEKSCKDSEARCGSGDLGKMCAYGYHSSGSGDYVSMKGLGMDELCRKYSLVSRRVLDKYFQGEVEEIRSADRDQGVCAGYSMGGEDGLSAYGLVSVDLVNAGHYDLDTSVGISVFNEKVAGRAVDWYFVLPNVYRVVGGDGDSGVESERKGLVLRLFDGCVIAWDGRKVFHCTGLGFVGDDDNHVYGNYWGGKMYR